MKLKISSKEGLWDKDKRISEVHVSKLVHDRFSKIISYPTQPCRSLKYFILISRYPNINKTLKTFFSLFNFRFLVQLRPPSSPASSEHSLLLDLDEADVLGSGLLLDGVALDLSRQVSAKHFQDRKLWTLAGCKRSRVRIDLLEEKLCECLENSWFV